MYSRGFYVKKKVDNYCVLDIETTGLSWQDDAIIEIGILKIRNNKAQKKRAAEKKKKGGHKDNLDWCQSFISSLLIKHSQGEQDSTVSKGFARTW